MTHWCSDMAWEKKHEILILVIITSANWHYRTRASYPLLSSKFYITYAKNRIWNIYWLTIKQYKVHFERWIRSYHSAIQNSLSWIGESELRIGTTSSTRRSVSFIWVNLHNTPKLPSDIQTIDMLYLHSSSTQSIPVTCCI